MSKSSFETSSILTIHLELMQYPMLTRQIRHQMREELYRRGVISRERFEQEVHEKAVLSQQREGLLNPVEEEAEPQWQERLRKIRNHLTEFYFANNLAIDLFHQIVEAVLSKRGRARDDLALTFNPELAPVEMLLREAERYTAMPPDQLEKVGHHLEEITVVLIKTLVSDHLDFVRIAKSWFTAQDFRFVFDRRIGEGKIGGKTAGMLLAWSILRKAVPSIAEQVCLPKSWFIGANVFYDFMSLNRLEYNQKYKSQEQIREEHPRIVAAYERARFPEPVADRLREVLREVGNTPLIVRSSSLLEDNFGTSFAGKYASFFCPNQGTLKENLRDLTLAIRRIYASVFGPDALFYRRHMGLLDYDERMAILLQEVQGQTYRDLFFPTLAGVAFSYSPIVWSPRLRREDGFVRLVMGIGTRAVDRVGEDHPRLVMLSHPTLRPEATPAAVRRNAQRQIDVIDLKANAFKSLPVSQVLDRGYPPLSLLASLDEDDTLMPVFFIGPRISPKKLVLTFDNLLKGGEFAPLMKSILTALEQHYHAPVDIEFAITTTNDPPRPKLKFHLLQCRPQSSMRSEAAGLMPTGLTDEDRLFVATHMVPQGQVSQIEYVVYVDPATYHRIPEPTRRREVARVVGRLNRALEGRHFILIGPGRWGSANLELGVPVGYADIYNARMLVELAVERDGITPEPSYGTHFFQDLVEAHIYPLAIYPEEKDEFLNRDFLARAQNQLGVLLPEDAGFADWVKVIHVPDEYADTTVEVAMDGQEAVAYFSGRGGVVEAEPPARSQPVDQDPQNPFYGW